jgi:serine/threonine-protein kinase
MNVPKPDPIRVGPYVLLDRIESSLPDEIYRATPAEPTREHERFVIRRARRDRRDFKQLSKLFHESAHHDSILDHRNITRFIDLHEDEVGLYLVLEWVRGTSVGAINTLLRNKGRALSFELACHIALETLSGLHYIHTLTDSDGKRMGLVVKNLTTPMLLVSEAGQVKLATSSLARVLIKPKRPMHGPNRFAHEPVEWIAGEKLTACSNVYSVGVILFELLLGRQCFYGSTVEEMLAQISHRGVRVDELSRAGVPERLCEIVQRATYVVPEHRFASALDMALAIADWLKGQGTHRNLASTLARFIWSHGLLENERDERQLVAPFDGATPSSRQKPSDEIDDGSSPDSFGLRKPLGRSDTIPRG